MKMCNVCFEKPYINTTMYYILFSIIAIASIILLPIGTKLREGAVSKRKSRTFGNVLGKQFDATTRQAHQHGEVVGAATPSAWERRGLARIRRENKIKDVRHVQNVPIVKSVYLNQIVWMNSLIVNNN